MKHYDEHILDAISYGEKSQQAIADRMSERGHKWHQATVYKVLRGQRRLMFNEAIDLADILGVDPLNGICLTTPHQYASGNAMRRIAAEVARWQEEALK